MTEHLERALAAVETLPPADQDRLASLLLAGKLAKLADEALAEVEAGRTLPFHDLS